MFITSSMYLSINLEIRWKSYQGGAV